MRRSGTPGAMGPNLPRRLPSRRFCDSIVVRTSLAVLAICCALLPLQLPFCCASLSSLSVCPWRTYARPRVALSAVAVPAPVKPETAAPGLPLPIDESRYGEAVRWLMDEDMEGPPPAWNLLLLDKTFEEQSNTLAYVAGCITTVLGLALAVAEQKAAHAQQHHFALLETTPEREEAFRKARALRDMKLLVRVTPASYLPPMDED
mmetsp:Transcript_79436/g.199630  ORF Transcript_79436/g.199630 Transcript_79436/m.199630 type:complete len:205 (+) Transcript_79436:24-638(+)